MGAFLRSGLFASAQFAASFAVIILISRSASIDARSGFFAAQAVILAITTTFGQTLALRYFQGRDGSISKALVAALTITFLLIWWLGSSGIFGARDIPFYAISAPLMIAGSLGFARMQQSSSPPHWPLCISVLRVAICAISLQMDVPVSVAFALNAAVFSFGFFLGSTQHAGRKSRTEPLLLLLVFFALSGFTFQWDRLLLASKGAPELIISSGVYLIWALPPISVLFTTLTRAKPGAVFVAKAKRGVVLRSKITIGFTIATVLYASTVAIFWIPLNALLFPFFSGSKWLALLLITALYLDRLGMLSLFQSRARIGSAILLKGVPLSVAVAIASLSEPTLQGLYSLYFTASVIFAFGMWWQR